MYMPAPSGKGRGIARARGRDVRLIWKRQSGGVVRILQYVADTGSGKWEQYGDLIYRREAAGAAAPQASSGASTP